MLSAVAVDVAGDTPAATNLTTEESTAEKAHSAFAHHASQRETDSFVKPWQGSWTLFSDIPFLTDGTITFHQAVDKPNGTTATDVTGLSDATVKKVKVIGDIVLVLQLRVFNDISNRTVNVTTALVLDPANMLNFQGDAKVQGGSGHEHTFWGQRLSGPDTATVELTGRGLDSEVRAGQTKPAYVTFTLSNLGPAAIPAEGAQFLIIFDHGEEDFQLVKVYSRGFAGVQQTTVGGNPAILCSVNPMLNATRKTPTLIQLRLLMNVPVTAQGTLLDELGHPIIPTQTASVTVQ